jgi:carotenoid cleavage dioxygenase-like enzyme
MADDARDVRAAFQTTAEELSDERLPVDGSFPGWLRGRYIQNGPGQFEVGGRPLGHWFDGLALLRGFAFDDEGVRYTNRFVRSRDFEFAREHGCVRTALPGTPSDRPVWTRLRQRFTGTFTDNPSIGVVRIDGRYLAVTESRWGLQFDPETLATTGRVDLTDGLDCDITLGHPQYDHDTGTFLNLGVSYGSETTYTLFRRADGSKPTPLTRVRFDEPPYVHSFAVTDHYVVFTPGPFGLDLGSLALGAVRGATFVDAFGPLDGTTSTRFVVLDRATGELETVARAPPVFVYHHANAFETSGGEVVVDLVAFPDEQALTGLTLEELRAGGRNVPDGDLVRYRLSLDGEVTDRRRLRRGRLEFPTIHYRRYLGRPYQYVYAAETHGRSPVPTDLVKVDVETGAARAWGRPGTYPGEPVFVPAPKPDAEDDGVLLSVVSDPAANHSALVCLDAATMAERGRANLPHHLPYGFHGQFYGPPDPGRSMA